jgi:hypothetical protein
METQTSDQQPKQAWTHSSHPKKCSNAWSLTLTCRKIRRTSNLSRRKHNINIIPETDWLLIFKTTSQSWTTSTQKSSSHKTFSTSETPCMDSWICWETNGNRSSRTFLIWKVSAIRPSRGGSTCMPTMGTKRWTIGWEGGWTRWGSTFIRWSFRTGRSMRTSTTLTCST